MTFKSCCRVLTVLLLSINYLGAQDSISDIGVVPGGALPSDDTKPKFEKPTLPEKQPRRPDESFYFNKKLFFSAKTSAYQATSYFYLNTKTGDTAVDATLGRQLGREFTTMTFNIKTGDGEYFVYTKSPNTMERLVTIAKEGFSFLPDYLDGITDGQYIKDHFKQTGEKSEVGDKGQFPSINYQGDAEDGGAIHMRLSENAGFELNPGNRELVVSVFGLGYIYFGGKTQVITHWQSDDYVAFLESIEDCNYTFNGKRYRTFQEKANEVIGETQSKVKSDFDKERQTLERRQSRAATGSGPTAAIEQQIVNLKKQIVDKQEYMTNHGFSKAKDLSKKEGDYSAMLQAFYSLSAGDDMVEIYLLEAQVASLECDKVIQNRNSSAKDKDIAKRKQICLNERISALQGVMSQLHSIDAAYPDDEKSRSSKKTTIIQSVFIPIMMNPCE